MGSCVNTTAAGLLCGVKGLQYDRGSLFLRSQLFTGTWTICSLLLSSHLSNKKRNCPKRVHSLFCEGVSSHTIAVLQVDAADY